jgi:hypothetical protein
MRVGRPWTQRWTPFLLAGLLLVVAAVSIRWALLVPIFQAPDETVHLDYALAILERGGLFQVHGSLPARSPFVHPLGQYLINETGTASVCFHPEMKMPPGYGLASFYEALDRHRPDEVALPPDATPALAWVYPYGYYALLAAWLDILRHMTDSLVVIFFGARLLSVLLLIVSLLCTYGTTREMGYGRGLSLGLVGIIGLFPLTSFVSSYVQPDNLSFTLVSLCMYLTLLVRQQPNRTWVIACLGTAFGCLLVTKPHYFLCTLVPAIGVLARVLVRSGAGAGKWLLWLFWLGVPSLLLGSVHLWMVWDATNYYSGSAAHDNGILFVLTGLKKALRDFFAGTSHKSFWGVFGWMDTPLLFGARWISAIVRAVLVFSTLAILLLTLVRLKQIMSRLLALVRRGKAGWAYRMAVSNPVLNSLFLFTLFMVFFYIRLDNRFGAQGRNWLPYLLPIFLLATQFGPNALSRLRGRTVLSRVAFAGLAVYSVVGNAFAMASIKDRFYDANNEQAMCLKAVPVQYLTHREPFAPGEEEAEDNKVAGMNLEKPEFVYAVRVRYVLQDCSEAKVRFQLFWQNRKPGSRFSFLRRLTMDWIPQPREKTICIWVNDSIDQFYIHPEDSLGEFQIRDITLYQRPGT